MNSCLPTDCHWDICRLALRLTCFLTMCMFVQETAKEGGILGRKYNRKVWFKLLVLSAGWGSHPRPRSIPCWGGQAGRRSRLQLEVVTWREHLSQKRLHSSCCSTDSNVGCLLNCRPYQLERDVVQTWQTHWQQYCVVSSCLVYPHLLGVSTQYWLTTVFSLVILRMIQSCSNLTNLQGRKWQTWVYKNSILPAMSVAMWWYGALTVDKNPTIDGVLNKVSHINSMNVKVTHKHSYKTVGSVVKCMTLITSD